MMDHRLRLLWYNTFLLPGVRVSPLMLGLILERALARSAFGGALHRLVTSRLPLLSESIDRPLLRLGRKPSFDVRTLEIAELLESLLSRSDVDATIVALGEVFSPETAALLEDAVSHLKVESTRGPSAGATGVSGATPPWLEPFMRDDELPLSSGLMNFVATRPVRRSAAEAFEFSDRASTDGSMTLLNRGHPVRDPDFWSNKGVLMTEIATDLTPDGREGIELYSTHLFSGQVIGQAIGYGLERLASTHRSVVVGLSALARSVRHFGLEKRLGSYRHYFDLPEALRLEIQQAQLNQLVDFILTHHRPHNVIVLAGDFNLDARSETHRDLLFGELSRLKDAAGIELDEAFLAGQAPSGTIFDLDQLYGSRSLASLDSERQTEHIDYLFVQRSHRAHELEVVIDSAHRRCFPRPAAEDGMNYLSDHVGLEVTLRARLPRRRPAR
jgi:hypothetical protein